jgi:hypothetical protein
MRHSPTIPERQRLPNRRVAEHIEDLNEAVPAAFAQGWLNYVRDHAHQQCKMNSPRVRDVAASPLGVPLDLLTPEARHDQDFTQHDQRQPSRPAMAAV